MITRPMEAGGTVPMVAQALRAARPLAHSLRGGRMRLLAPAADAGSGHPHDLRFAREARNS